MSLDIEPLESPVWEARQDVARSVLTGVANGEMGHKGVVGGWVLLI